MRPLGFRPSPPTIAELYFCIHLYQAACKACISSGEGWARLSVDSRKMNKNFAMTVLQTVSLTPTEACPPPSATTTNKLQPFRHRRGKKNRRARCDSRSVHSQARLLAESVLPLAAGWDILPERDYVESLGHVGTGACRP